MGENVKALDRGVSRSVDAGDEGTLGLRERWHFRQGAFAAAFRRPEADCCWVLLISPLGVGEVEIPI